MTKFFNTNYHFITPEIWNGQQYRIARESLFEQVEEAKATVGSAQLKVVIPGPLTWLWFGKGEDFSQGASDIRKLTLLDSLLPVYEAVLERLSKQQVGWVQIDEQILTLDLTPEWRQAFHSVYTKLTNAVPSFPRILVPCWTTLKLVCLCLLLPFTSMSSVLQNS